MFVEGLYYIPEIRTITPSHLVRSGFTSAYDCNFGMEAGATAVCLLLDGIYGVTTTGMSKGKIFYMDIKEAISQRCVDASQVALYEQLGFCFGRIREEYQASFERISGRIDRIY